MKLLDIKGVAHPSNGGGNDNMIVAPIGYARTGKDAFAKIAVEEFGFTRFAFADKLRECLYALNPIVRANEEFNTPFEGPMMFARLRDVIDEDGWGGYKEGHYGDEIRQLLQRFGTEVGRETISENIWVDELDKHNGKIVVTDCRFQNEYNKVKARGGTVVRIHREGYEPINGHKSETIIDEFPEIDGEIHNNGTLEAYENAVREFLSGL